MIFALKLKKRKAQNVLKTTNTTYEGNKRDEMAHIKFIASGVTAKSPN